MDIITIIIICWVIIAFVEFITSPDPLGFLMGCSAGISIPLIIFLFLLDYFTNKKGKPKEDKNHAL
jgi:hypothetical protein